ncbi:hypothetical protein ACP275_02G179400 [Erythranthe tilingii]
MDMSDSNEGEEIVRKGNEWEVVVLTESTYAAAPNPKEDVRDTIQSNLIGEDNADSAHPAMFMSGHFKLSPSTDKNLQVEPEYEGNVGQQSCNPDLKHEEDLHIEGLISDEFTGVPHFEEKGNSMSFFGSDFGDIASSNLIEKEQSMYSTRTVVSCDDEANEGTEIDEPFESLDQSVNPGISNVQKRIEEDKSNELPNLPWWRKHGASLYGHVKNVNPFWPYFVAATVVVGFVIIGRRWQRDKPQVFRIKPLLVIADEGSGWVIGNISRLKYVSSGGHRHSSYSRMSSSTEL